MPFLSAQRRDNLLGQIQVNRGTWRALGPTVTGKKTRGPAAAMFVQLKWAHDVLEEMLNAHVYLDEATPVSAPRTTKQPKRARTRRD